MKYTLSLHNGSAVCQKHNNRDKDTIAKEEHINKDGEHITLRHEEIRKALKKLFSKALDDYNKKVATKNPDRIKTIQEYINSIFANMNKTKQATKPAYELILQIGDKDNVPGSETCKMIFEEYLNEFEHANKTLKVVGAYIHNDEQGGIHMHLDYIPCAACERGMALQPSLSKALEQLNYKNVNHKDTAQMQFQKAERQRLTEICNSYGIEIEAAKGGKKHLETELFKLEQDKNRLKQEVEQLETEKEEASQYYNDKKMTLEEVKQDIDKNYNQAVESYRNLKNEELEQRKSEVNDKASKIMQDYRANINMHIEERKNELLEEKLKELGLTHELMFNDINR